MLLYMFLLLFTLLLPLTCCNVDGQSVSRQRPVNNLQSRKHIQQ
jgi:hypothetical protein